MKKLIIAAIGCLCITACTKTRNILVPVPTHDTVNCASLIGSWQTPDGSSTQKAMLPTFTTDTITL